jgi:Uncharacterized protein conserved in bacteria (DUF2188)
MSNVNVWVSPNKNGWSVKKEGNKKCSKICSTQRAAIKIAKWQVKNEKSALIVQGKDGKINRRDSYEKILKLLNTKAVMKHATQSNTNNTIYTKKSNLDQFYTAELIAKECYDKIIEIYGEDNFELFFESSAGNGSFYNLFPKSKRLGIDLDPKCDEIIRQDFLEFKLEEGKYQGKIATIGNPPFGKNSSLAAKFFNKAAEFSDIIAFIIPKTFRKKSLQDRLNLNFHIKFDTDLPKYSFILNGEPYDVPCCFQIWERTRTKRRVKKISLENILFKFTTKEEANLAVRRVGGRTGKATTDIEMLAKVSHYFLKTKSSISPDWLVEIINSINFGKVINATAGVKSLSKPEFINALSKICDLK